MTVVAARAIRDLLDEHPFFVDLSDEARALLAGCGSNTHFEPGEMIFREGEPADRFFVIRKGRVALEIHDPGRPPIVVGTLDAGEVLGASWLIPPHRWNLDARAVTSTSAIALDADCLRQKCDEDTDLGYRLVKRFAQLAVEHLHSARLQLLDLYGTGAEAERR